MAKLIPLFVLIVLLVGCKSDREQHICLKDSFPELPNVTINLVAHEELPVPHCKIIGVIGPEIKFELLLPVSWNGKFVMGGGGGFVGSVMNTSLMFGSLQSGYATVGTDTGHEGHPLDASWAYNDLERLVNFGHQAVHRTAVTAKALIKAHYKKEIIRSYFTGCSRGGSQGLMAAQRYPEDFDGIVVGAPAYDWIGLAALATQITKAMYPDPDNLEKALIGPEEQALIESSYLEMCDEQDGIKDGILNDPRKCKFDLETLLCKGEKTQNCLTAEQLAAIRVIYDGPKDSKGNLLFYGFPFGGETSIGGWPRWLTGGLKYQSELDEFQGGVETGDFDTPVSPNAYYGFGNGIMKYFIYNDPDWNYTTYNYDRLRKDSERVAETLNATNPDLSAFRERGGKLLMYTGWSDAAAPADAVIGYYEEVLTQDKNAINDVRLFMMPGVEHCFGGPGPSFVNFLVEMDTWLETGNAPEQIDVYWLDENMQSDGSRIICAYPSVSRYDGKGDTRDASSFICVQDN
jgi:feruloyl esterase